MCVCVCACNYTYVNLNINWHPPECKQTYGCFKTWGTPEGYGRVSCVFLKDQLGRALCLDKPIALQENMT